MARRNDVLPPAPDGTVQVVIRLGRAERDALAPIARAAGFSVSSYLRRLIQTEIEKFRKNPRNIL